VQMPSGVPVATMAIGKAGATNAAVFAVQILAAGGNADLTKQLVDYKKMLADKVLKVSKTVQQRLRDSLADNSDDGPAASDIKPRNARRSR
jgi:5-(carboxyamino)imidazole ribonucleotide mutase